ncbi:ImmA/IrrE family metallo-endopeptidase [Litorihabitans aurantiacus]|uniref:IrrE N-terminal-like domain-containing protein n=1 Tax=Litorihabitans aurantiacus TaxID=1930061 RepID=A0AA37XHE6_9MICO|nr:ImmA/IrrE family metallo-endopeptidase [Litorihabitans aurantiacus]GMA33179.1 hypothetical protein GCM10025875_31710 [Litorihabitans aurantiacus]
MTAPPAAPARDGRAAWGAAIQDDLLASLGVPAASAGGPSRERHDRTRLESKRQRLLQLAVQAREFAKEPSVPDVMRSAWQFWPRFAIYNGLLIVSQRPSATHVESPETWRTRYGMVPLPHEQPLLLLHQGGPLGFVFDASQVEPGPEPGTHRYEAEQPFARPAFADAPQVVATLVEAVKARGVRVVQHGLGVVRGGHVMATSSGAVQEVTTGRRPPVVEQVPVSFDVSLNSRLPPTEQLATLVHELGHLYCGHLGPDPALERTGQGLWLEREGLEHAQREAEADFVAETVMGFIDPEAALPIRSDDGAPPLGRESAVAAALAVELVLDGVTDALVRSG